MATVGFDTLIAPKPFKAKGKDPQTLLIDFDQYIKSVENFFVATDKHNVSNKQKIALLQAVGGVDMIYLVEKTGKVVLNSIPAHEETGTAAIEADTFDQAIHKIRRGIISQNSQINQTLLRLKLFQQMGQGSRSFESWAREIYEQAQKCDWSGYNAETAARDAILYQTADCKLREKILEDNLSYKDTLTYRALEELCSVDNETLPMDEMPSDGDFEDAKREEFDQSKEIMVKEENEDADIPDPSYLEPDIFFKQHNASTSHEDEEIIVKIDGLWKCQVCGKTSVRRSNAKAHALEVHFKKNSKRAQFDQCEKAKGQIKDGDSSHPSYLEPEIFLSQHDTSTSVDDEKIIVKNDGLWECKVCGKTSLRRSNARAHALHVHFKSLLPKDENEYSCEVCGKIFKTFSAFRSHKFYKHDSKETFTCCSCGKSGMTKLQFKSHKYSSKT